MKISSTKGMSTELTGTIQNPFFNQKYNQHALLYSYSNEQLPLIVKRTKSLVLPKDSVTVKANSKLDIKTGIALIRKPPGSRITISFNILPVGVHNWESHFSIVLVLYSEYWKKTVPNGFGQTLTMNTGSIVETCLCIIHATLKRVV